jgi:ATP-dependent RNA helicase HelY
MKLRMPEMPPATLLTALGQYNLLPAIVFLPTRRRCDQAASDAAFTRRDPNVARRDRRRDFMESFVREHPEVRGHRHWDTIIRGGVASHHAGHIPAWKLVIENLMSAGLLDAIFATATVAAGVDFPARTVVLTGADARTASGWRQLTASELQQMTGRAGRRGRDRVGFIVAAPGVHQDPQKIVELLRAPPDPLVSQFRATYSTLLNLLDAYGNFAQVREIAEKSFAHRDAAQRMARLAKERNESEASIRLKLEAAGCPFSLESVLGVERLVSARTRLQQTKPQTRVEVLLRWLDEAVQPGRVVGIGRSGRRLVIVTGRREGNVTGIREDGRSASFPLQRIGRVYAPGYPLREESIAEAFEEIRTRGKELALPEPRLRDIKDEESDAVNVLEGLIESVTHDTGLNLTGEQKAKCTEALWASLADAEAIQRAARLNETLRDEVWQPFEQRARVLAAFGYLDFETEKVTERGRWLADLHVDRPLLVGEALEKGLFAEIVGTRMAAVMAALTADEDRDYGELELDDALVTTLARFEEIGFGVATEEWQHGIEPAPELNFSAAGAAAQWAAGSEWSSLVQKTRAEEGDLFRMLSRTGEALLQIAGLRKAHPQAARIAAIAAETVLREPVR